MSRTRASRSRSNLGGAATKEEPKYLLTLAFSILLLVILWLDHGQLPDATGVPSSRRPGVSPIPPVPKPHEPVESSIKRKLRKPFSHMVDRHSKLEFKKYTKKYDCVKPVIITDAIQGWGALGWTREMFVEKYASELLAVAVTKGGLHKREVYVMPVKDLDKQMTNGSARSWSMAEDEMFLKMHPELLGDLGNLVYAKDDLFELFPESVRPSNVTLQWGSQFARSNLKVNHYNWTSTDILFYGRKYWKLFPPEQDQYLYSEQETSSLDSYSQHAGGILSGLALQCRLYSSPVDAFMPDYTRYPLFARAQPYIAEQGPGEVLITPPGWYMQAFYPEESLGMSGQILNEKNVDIVLTEIMKIREQVSWNRLPFNLESLPAGEQVSAVLANLHESVYWRANVTRTALLLQFGGKVQYGQPIQLITSSGGGQCSGSVSPASMPQLQQHVQAALESTQACANKQ